ncbi:large ribosomal subunit protein mL40 isoform X1 [Equus przewalskii]|uniref:Large ribosomal subunit protein mL40 n=2 Tax=Equus TaxID=9789 RepID=A0A9L0TIR7_HORSE|nr:39S ribosomal protein L40, mitochondrial isoform X1 [Equus caballus]
MRLLGISRAPGHVPAPGCTHRGAAAPGARTNAGGPSQPRGESRGARGGRVYWEIGAFSQTWTLGPGGGEGHPLGHSGRTAGSWPSQGRRPTTEGNAGGDVPAAEEIPRCRPQAKERPPRSARLLGTWQTQIRDTRRRASLLSFWDLVPMRAEPLRKKKKVDPKKDQAVKDRLKKRIRRLEKASQELIPIEDFITPVKFLDQARQRPHTELPFEEGERRALLLKKWSLYKQREHEMERDTIRSMLEAQQEALQELQLMSPELHEEAIKRDPCLFPFEREGPDYTPPVSNYQPPEGRYQDITKVYTQVEFKR